MPIFDDRFARQNRCELPPEFPLASPYIGIVHLLSGPTQSALTQIHPNTSGSVDDAPKLSPPFTFISRRGLTPKHSQTRSTPWSVFQDGSLKTITPASLRMRGPQSVGGYYTEAITLRRATFQRSFPSVELMLARTRRVHRRERRLSYGPESGRKRFPFNNFTYCLTLFPKCFSSFDHSTCALSVSGRYLVLEEVYLPFRAAFPNYSTRRGSFTQVRRPTVRGSHPLRRPVPGNLGRRVAKSILCKLQFGPRARFQIWTVAASLAVTEGNPCWFLFLRLLICLSSAGIPT